MPGRASEPGMAMRMRPPQHRVDSAIIWVHPEDPSWDHERIERERDELESTGQKKEDHPVSRYLAGDTRYDLDAPMPLGEEAVTARSYLRTDEPATLWYLNRLDPRQHIEAKSQMAQEMGRGAALPVMTYLWCCERGIKKVENGPDLDGIGDRKILRSSDLAKLKRIDDDLSTLLGMAVFIASSELREDEKKR